MPHHSQSRFALSEVFTSCGIGLLPILAKSSLQVYKRMELFVVKFSVMVLQQARINNYICSSHANFGSLIYKFSSHQTKHHHPNSNYTHLQGLFQPLNLISVYCIDRVFDLLPYTEEIGLISLFSQNILYLFYSMLNHGCFRADVDFSNNRSILSQYRGKNLTFLVCGKTLCLKMQKYSFTFLK